MSISRRTLLQGVLGVSAASVLARAGQAASAAAPRDDRPVAPGVDAGAADFHFVHMTDMHVTPKRKGDVGYERCVESVRGLAERPAFALMGGDLAFDGLYTERAAFEEQIRLYREITARLGVPAYPAMGNHDVLGWSSRRKVATSDPELGKKMIMERLEWERPYYSFDHGGWHFAVLDSIHPKTFEHGPGYEPRIGPEQLEWLGHDLGAAGERPKVVLTHIAAFCNVGQMNGDAEARAMNGNMVLWDTQALREVLERHGVRALLQGHSHRIEEYRLNGVWYLTSAAVSGAWWAGSWVGSPPGYTLFRCRGGELSWEHRTFEWTPQLEPGDELERGRIAEQAAFEQRQRELRAREREKVGT